VAEGETAAAADPKHPAAVAVFLGFSVLACGWLLAYFPIMTNYDIDAHLLQIAAHQYENPPFPALYAAAGGAAADLRRPGLVTPGRFSRSGFCRRPS
jgi:hypothetical protein